MRASALLLLCASLGAPAHAATLRVTVGGERGAIDVLVGTRDALVEGYARRNRGSKRQLIEHHDLLRRELDAKIRIGLEQPLCVHEIGKSLGAENVTLRVIRVLDLVRQKIRAGSDPAPRGAGGHGWSVVSSRLVEQRDR